MANDADVAGALNGAWADPEPAEPVHDYALLAKIGAAYAARSRSGHPAVVIPFPNLGPSATGRRTSGCELVAHPSTSFSYRGQTWDSPAGALVCTDPDLRQAFSILAADALTRLGEQLTWDGLVETVEEWQTLLMPRPKPSAEEELGLWGELWFIHRSSDVARTLSGWRGPENDSVDFFVDQQAVEIKASRVERLHYISQSQVETPVGIHSAWLLSLWVKRDPAARLTVGLLADLILKSAPSRAEALRQLMRAGFSPKNRRDYASAYTLLNEPEWYAAEDVPRVRAADAGISHLRYRAALDKTRRADGATAQRLWRHFHGHDYSGER